MGIEMKLKVIRLLLLSTAVVLLVTFGGVSEVLAALVSAHPLLGKD